MEQTPALAMAPPTPVPPSLPMPIGPSDQTASSIASSSTLTPADASSPQPQVEALSASERAFQLGLSRANLEQEVGQVMGTLNSWWGGVKKQSVSALSTIKADIDKTVIQAQADFEHLRTAKIEIVQKDLAAVSPADETAKEKGKSRETQLGTDPASADVASASLSTLLGRLSSSTSNLQHSVQSSIQSTLAAASNSSTLHNPALLRDQIAENLRLSSARQNLQLSMKQAEKIAEEYLRRGDQLVKDAEKWVGDAVKVLPPEAEAARGSGGVSWDGSDFYTFTTSPSNSTDTSSTPDQPRDTMSGVILAGSRKEALMRRLREDKHLLLVDPAAESESIERQDAFRAWLHDSWPHEEEKVRPQEEGNVGNLRMELVPEPLTDEQFWQRYLFHKHMIEAEENKRKLLLHESQQAHPDDFSWDDEPEEAAPADRIQANPARSLTPDVAGPAETPPTPRAGDSGKLPGSAAVAASSGEPAPAASASTSPRDSEESYDLVSDQAGKLQKTAASTTEDEDSDWE